MPEISILIVEDEWLVAEEHRTMVEDAGFAVVGPVASVKQALNLIETEYVSAAILDIGLNGETSDPLVPHLQQRNIPFVFVSGYAPADIPATLRVHPVLAKPVVVSILIEAIRDILE
jgi:CheY-like chemotaxis protein